MYKKSAWLLAAIVILCGCATPNHPEPSIPKPFTSLNGAATITVAQSNRVFDRDLMMTVTGLEPGAVVTLLVTSKDIKGQHWKSENSYRADPSGRISLAQHAPIKGSYSGINAMGPFWSMTGGQKFYTGGNADLLIEVMYGDITVASEAFVWVSPRVLTGVNTKTIRTDDLTANLYLPEAAPNPGPALLLLGGSGGGFNGERAALLASHGYIVLDIAYFKADGRPDYFLESQPLEYFIMALDFLVGYPGVDPDKVGVMGKSYGAQLALLLASHEPRLALVVAEAPSSFVTGTVHTLPTGPYASAWSYRGEQFAFLKTGDRGRSPVNPKQVFIADASLETMMKTAVESGAVINVERIKGPILLISGEDDQIWDASAMSEQMMARLSANEFAFEARHLQYPDAGHNLAGGQQAYGIANLPPKDRGGSSGGSRQGNSVAGVDAWAQTLEFMKLHFDRP